MSQVGDEKMGEVLAGAGAFALDLGGGSGAMDKLFLILAGGENVAGEIRRRWPRFFERPLGYRELRAKFRDRVGHSCCLSGNHESGRPSVVRSYC